MAKIKFSALVSEVRGKLNGSVLSKNRYGSYMRNKVTPVNPQTDSQVSARSVLSQFSQGWRSLTEAQRSAWIGAVNDWAGTNIFGDLVNPSGNNLYTKVNINLSTAGSAPVTLPPVKVGAAALNSISATATAGVPSFDLDFDPTPVPADHVLVVEATAGLSAGINFFKSRFRQIAVLPAATATGEDILTAYTDKFGTLVAGKKIALRGKFINSVTGEVSQALQTTLIVGA